uniref:PPPDE domain-containing protein n=1 Tax=Elaeophora elaphi TaxID=1147741 RepID=A0A158Q7L4_9BILA
MAQLYNGFRVTASAPQQLIVQCPNCTARFCLSPTFIYPQNWPQNMVYSQPSSFQFIQPFIQNLRAQIGMQSAFYTPSPSTYYVFSTNQQHQEMIDSANSRQYVSQNAVNVSDTIIHRIRDILIDILNSAMCKYGITACQLMILLKHSCVNWNIILPSSITDDFTEFLRDKMTDYVEIEDDLCRYRRPTLSIQEESISNSSVCKRTSVCSETSPAALIPWQALQRYRITSVIDTNASCSVDEAEKITWIKEEVKGSITNVEEPSFNLTNFHDNRIKSKQFFDGVEEYQRIDDADKMTVTDPVLSDGEKKCNIHHRYVESNEHHRLIYLFGRGYFRKENIIGIVEKWKEIFIGDLKELIRYLRMVNDYFLENDGKFTLAEFKDVFGELSKRWEFCDIDLIEMGVINIVRGMNEESVFIVNPIIREMEFPEMTELAKEIYNLLSKLLQSMNSVKVEVIVRTVNFGVNNSKTIDEKYTLLWEVLSDSHFQDAFVVDILRKQNKERGFDVMIRFNPNLDLRRIFAE